MVAPGESNMTRTFYAIFENGVFRPVGHIDFPEHCQVCVEVRTVQAGETKARPDGDGAEIPPPRRVRLVGRVATVYGDANAFDLVLDDAYRIRVQWIGGDIAAVAGLTKGRVLVLGTAIYGAMGNLLRIDADDVTYSSDMGSFFSAIPRPVYHGFYLDGVLHEQRQKVGLAAIIGQWPGDESDEEVAAALKELS